MKTEIFQSTLPRGERHLRREIQRQFIHNFNPRSREGSDTFPHTRDAAVSISIRAPARGATIFSTHFLQVFIISIRAPARGATHLVISLKPEKQFQSALPRGERLGFFPFFYSFLLFQSALPRGERPRKNSMLPPPIRFQSALPRGERPSTKTIMSTIEEFQSALPRGERRAGVAVRYGIRWLFQSALPRGERLGRKILSEDDSIFQSALPRGERHCQSHGCTDIKHFNPRSREGSDGDKRRWIR